MAEDRRIREAESEAYQAAAVERTTRLSSRIAYLEKELQNTTKDFILCESPAARICIDIQKHPKWRQIMYTCHCNSIYCSGEGCLYGQEAS